MHLSSVHLASDIRIYQKEALTMAAAGHDVAVVAVGIHDEAANGIRVKAIPRAKNRFERMTATAWKVFRIALKNPADIYQFHDPELLPWAQLLRLGGNRVVCDMHENVPKAILTKPWIPTVLRRSLCSAYRLLERALLTGIPVVFAENSYEPDYPFVTAKTVVLNMPLLDRLLSISEPRYAKPTLAYLGSVTAQRGSLTTLEALRLLKQEGYAVDWDCMGEMTLSHGNELRGFIRQHSLSGVRMHGFTSHDQAWHTVAKCHIGLAVLHDVPNLRDSYPTKVFEYMSLGVPVVISDFPLYRALINETHCGICVEPGNASQLAQGIRWLLTHPEEASRMARSGREAARQRYNWANEANKLVDFYSKIVA